MEVDNVPQTTQYEESEELALRLDPPVPRQNSTISWEVSFPVVMVWLWARHTRERGGRLRRALLRWDLRVVYVAVGLVMHGLTWLLMDVGPFSPVTCCFYLCLFHPDEYHRLGRKLSQARLREGGGG